MKKIYGCFFILVIFVTNFIGITTICTAIISDNSESNTRIVTDRLEKIKNKGVLTVASSNDVPFSFIDSKSQKLTGIDGDIITEAAKRLGINKVELKYVPFEELFTQILVDEDIDIIADATYITDERKKLVSFTYPWYKDFEVIITPKVSKIVFKEDLKNASVGVQLGTIAASFAQNLKKEGKIKDVIIFPNQKELLSSINSSKIDVGISDAITASYALSQNPNLYLKILSRKEYEPELYGEVAAAVRQSDTTLLNAINTQINEMKMDKTISQILKKYGLNDSYIIPTNKLF